MRYLRSPSSHNLDLDFRALREFARRRGADPTAVTADPAAAAAADGEAAPLFIPPYARPTLELFNAHAAEVIAEAALTAPRRHARLLDVEARADGVRVRTDDGEEGADFLILAVGRTEMPFRPAWARGLSPGGAGARPRVVHVFDPDFDPERLEHAAAPVVIGGGVTAAQVACHAARRSGRQVVLLTRGPLRVGQFDSEPCFIGPRCLAGFLAEPTPAARREYIEEARHPGTMPWDVEQTLLAEERVTILEDDVSGIEPAGVADAVGGMLRVHLRDEVQPVESDLVVLATGFERRLPLSGIIADLAHRHGLPTGPYGSPVPDRYLRWHPRVLVTGALGELEIGPAAPNIIGAHLAARRIVPFFRDDLDSTSGDARDIAWTALTHYLEN
jgi:thioredoxin reductase